MKIIFLAILIGNVAFLSVFAQKAEKIDEFSNINCDTYLARIDNATIRVENDPTVLVYFLIYEGKEKRYDARSHRTVLINSPVGSAQAKIRSMKAYLLLRKSPLKNYVFVKAGFRENSTVEIWLVKNVSNLPKPTPTLEKGRYGRRKALGFCTGCCGE